MGVGINKINLYKRGFSLVELLIAVGIILVLAAVAIPNFNNFEAETNFDNKVQEIESLFDQMGAMVKNPEIGVVSYSMETTATKLILKRSDNTVVKEVLVSSGQDLSGTANISCIVKDEVCVPPPPAPAGILLTDSNPDTAKTAAFNIRFNPLAVNVEKN